MKGKILILSNSIGGLFAFRKEVIKAISDKGFEVLICTPSIEDERSSYFNEIGCQLIVVPFDRRGTNPIADFKLMLNYRRLIKQIEPVAVLTYTIKPNVYGGIACRLTQTPQLANVTGLGDAIENGGWLQRLTITLYKIGLKKAYKIFFQNRTNRDYCIRCGIASEDSVLLPGSGVNLGYHVYQEYPKETDCLKFLYVGRVIKDKGISELFETIESIKNKYPNVVFQILGSDEGPYQERLKKYVDEGKIEYLGHTNDVRPYYSPVHCTIMPSYHEGMSNVNLESAANGRPVITTNVPGCQETVDDARTGFLVDVKSSTSLTKAVEKFINMPYEEKIQMSRDGRKKVEKEFDRQIVVNSYLKEIERISNV